MQYSRQVSEPSMSRRPQQVKLPLAVRAVIVGMVAAFVSDVFLSPFFSIGSLFGFRLTSLGWLVPLLLGVRVLLKTHPRRICFPTWIWLPWSLWVIGYLWEAETPNALQRSVMLLTPLVVGMAVSTIRLDLTLLPVISRRLDQFFWLFLLAVGLTTGLLTTGKLAAVSGFAAGSITAALLAAWYAGRYVTFNKRWDLYRWAALAAVPVLANTRTGMVAVAVTLPLTLVPWPMAKRLIVTGILVVAGLLVFQMERIQNKMFYSGEGTLEEAVNSAIGLFTGESVDPDFQTSGRQAMNQALQWGLEGHYWFGHGTNAAEEVSFAIAGVTHPHNDWLRLQYDYGTLGMTLFALTLLVMVWHAWALARRLPPATALYLYVGAGAFVPMAIYMFADNVILYAAWFGNLHFALLGLGYAAARDLPQSRRRWPRVRWG